MLKKGMATMTYQVRAVHWAHGWELHIKGEGVTQVKTLSKAQQQVRDYLESMHERSFDDASINVTIDLDGLEQEASAARAATIKAAEAQEQAAKSARQVAKKLREAGLTVSDTAEVLGVSKGRISQLTAA